MNDIKIKSSAMLITLRWIARVWSIGSIGIILLFFIGEGFAPAKVTPKEWVGFIFFPIGVTAGMLVAWWKEAWGGGITTMSLLAFYGVYGYLISGSFPKGWAFVIFSAPGLLFLAYWLLSRLVRQRTAT